ncbi:MAG: histidine kinase [Bacteroidales bacterium]|nr:histidine kinase [Bacteroidales bacterium]
MIKHNKKPTFLSLRTILLLSLGISVGFHVIFTISAFFGDTLFFPEVKQNMQRHVHFGRILLFTAMNFILVFVLFLYNRKMFTIDFKKRWRKVLFIILGSMLITAAISLCFTMAVLFSKPHQPDPDMMARIIRDGMVRDFSFMVVVLLLTKLLHTLYERNNIAVENEALRAENVITHYEALKSQMDPHFMFNSLNTLQSIIGTDAEKAQHYVQELSQVLRATLQNKEVVTLEQELQGVQAYCNLMQIRYGDNLRFDFQIDSKYHSFLLLPLSLQGLVENAIKHNVISGKQPLLVSIVTTEEPSLKVSNPIQPKIMEETGNGIGLANLSERYQLKWNRNVEIVNDGTTFEVVLPLIEPNA